MMAADLSDLRRAVSQYGQDVTDQAARELLRVTKAEAPRGETGNLEKSGHLENQRQTADSAQVTLTYDAEGDPKYGSYIYASVVDQGSRPHVIRARVPGGKLAFRGRDGGMVYRASVEHPGTRATKFFSANVTLEAWTRFLQEAAQITPST